jgi:hypothetical protein
MFIEYRCQVLVPGTLQRFVSQLRVRLHMYSEPAGYPGYSLSDEHDFAEISPIFSASEKPFWSTSEVVQSD